MSSTTKWLSIGVVVIVLAALVAWYSGWIGAPAASQSAAVSNSVPATPAPGAVSPAVNASGDAVLAQDAANLDVQIKASAAGAAALTSPTAATITAAATQTQGVLTAMGTLGAKIQTRVLASGKMQSSLQALLADMNLNIGNANSQIAAATKNIAKSATPAALAAAKSQLQAAQGYVQSARTDIQKLLQGVQGH